MPKHLSIDIISTSHGDMYQVIDEDGLIYLTTFDRHIADICLSAIKDSFGLE